MQEGGEETMKGQDWGYLEETGEMREREKAIKDGKWRLFWVHPEIWDYSTRCIKMCHRMHSVAWSRNLSALE